MYDVGKRSSVVSGRTRLDTSPHAYSPFLAPELQPRWHALQMCEHTHSKSACGQEAIKPFQTQKCSGRGYDLKVYREVVAMAHCSEI